MSQTESSDWTNLRRAANAIKESSYAKKFSHVEQYLFGFQYSTLVFVTNEHNKPFKVCKFNNIDLVYEIEEYDSRTLANKVMTSRWNQQF